MSAFAEAAAIFGWQGVAVIPTRPDKPATPMVKHPDKFGVRAIGALLEKPQFADANAAVWMGSKARVTVVDVDTADPKRHADAVNTFGDTPLKVRTPSGGLHLWYRHNNERRRVRVFGKTFPVDILGSGLAVVPPSLRPANANKRAGAYQVIEGDLGALDRLPLMRAGALPHRLRAAGEGQRGAGQGVEGMVEGAGRDDALFRHILRLARGCSNADDLARRALAANATMADPLPANEVLGKAARAWQYRQDGTLMVPGDRAAVIGLADITRCGDQPVAFWLLALLRGNHGPDHIFAVAPEPMSKTCGHSHNTLRKARDWLVAQGLLVLVRRGRPSGKGRGSPNLYRLAATQI